jgi:hypothetical protein
MKRWTTETWLAGMPDEVLELLTDPEAIARWAPIEFEVLQLEGDRLETGSRARVRGGLAGRHLEFDVKIREAHNRCLSLSANGPVSIDAEYLLSPTGGGSSVRASVSVSGRGFIGRALAGAVEALLAAGVLRASVARLGRELEPVAPGQWRHSNRRHRRPARRDCVIPAIRPRPSDARPHQMRRVGSHPAGKVTATRGGTASEP